MRARFRLSTRYGINTAILVALALGVAVLVEAFSYRHDWRKDFTETGRHSLSEQTVSVLRDLDEPIQVSVFVRKASPTYEEVKELFDLYEYRTDNFHLEIIDPDLNPARAREVDIMRYGSVVAFFEGETGRETITDLTEEQITNALIKVTRGEKKKVYFLGGHGERLLDDREDGGLTVVKQLLTDKNYEPQPLMLMREESVPEDCAILVVAGPQTDLAGPEIESIERYIDQGGRALFLIDPETASSLKPLLEKYGIVLGDDYVVDRLSRLFGGDYLMPVPTTYSNHPITRNFNIMAFFPVARSVSTGEATGVRASWLAKTGEGSWAETDLEALEKNRASFDPQRDIPGPVTLGVASEMVSSDAAEGESGGGAIVVYGDSDFVTNSRINLSGNSYLFMNTINWLAREETLIAIPPKETKFSPVVLTAAEGRLLFLLPVVVLPGVVFLAAGFVFIRRSRHP